MKDILTSENKFTIQDSSTHSKQKFEINIFCDLITSPKIYETDIT